DLLPVIRGDIEQSDGRSQCGRIALLLRAEPMQSGEPLGGLVVAEIEAVPAVTGARSPAQGGVAVATDDDRNPPVLQGFCVQMYGVEVHELTVEAGNIVAPQCA